MLALTQPGEGQIQQLPHRQEAAAPTAGVNSACCLGGSCSSFGPPASSRGRQGNLNSHQCTGGLDGSAGLVSTQSGLRPAGLITAEFRPVGLATAGHGRDVHVHPSLQVLQQRGGQQPELMLLEVLGSISGGGSDGSGREGGGGFLAAGSAAASVGWVLLLLGLLQEEAAGTA